MNASFPVDRARLRAWLRRLTEWLASPEAALLGAVAFALALLLSSDAFARPGGGHGYSGGSRSSGSSGGSSGGSGGGGGDGLFALVYLLLRLCFEYPVIGIPLMLIFLAVLFGSAIARMKRTSYGDWESGVAAPTRPAYQQPAPARAANPRRSLEALRAVDQNFSTVLFEDFLYSLFAEVHRSRGGGNLARLSPYVAPDVIAQLSRSPVAEVSGIVVGAMRVTSVSGASASDAFTRVRVEFEANYAERPQPNAPPQGYYVVEQWALARRNGVQSRTPDRATVIGCPSCGAPLDVVMAGRCSHCSQNVNTGGFDWIVQAVQLSQRETRGPALTANVQEQGTNLPTIVDPGARQALQALSAKDAQFRWETFQQRVGLIFSEFQVAWSSRDLARMRPFLSDNLLQIQSYWVESYKQQRLRNVTENTRINALELAKVGTDRFFDAITIRLYATGLDYTISDGGGNVVQGNRNRERSYTEYWTFVRGVGRSAPTHTDRTCPNCGAPLQINMAGHCEYCKAKVTSGEFDWVLSRIEQDESYNG